MQVAAGEVVIDGTVPGVGTALGDHIDGTALETALTDVEGSDVDTDLVDGIQGDGRAAGRQVGADTEGVVERCTIYRNGGTTVVTAADGKTAAGHGCLRCELHHIVQAAGDGRHRLHHPGVDQRTCSGTVDVHRRSFAITIDGHLFQLFGRFGQDHIHDGCFRDGSHHFLDDSRVVVDTVDLHRVRTTGHDVADRVDTLAVGDSVIRRVRRHVHDRHNGLFHSTFAVTDIASDG